MVVCPIDFVCSCMCLASPHQKRGPWDKGTYLYHVFDGGQGGTVAYSNTQLQHPGLLHAACLVQQQQCECFPSRLLLAGGNATPLQHRGGLAGVARAASGAVQALSIE